MQKREVGVRGAYKGLTPKALSRERRVRARVGYSLWYSWSSMISLVRQEKNKNVLRNNYYCKNNKIICTEMYIISPNFYHVFHDEKPKFK